MKERTHGFLYGLNMWVEGERGWFVGEHIQALFEWDYNTHMCRLISALPDYDEIRFCGNSKCVKHKEYIYCLPQAGKCIWIYDLQKHVFDKIEIDNPLDIKMRMDYVGRKGNEIFLFSHGLKKLFKINGEHKKIVNEYLFGNESDIYSNFLFMNDKILTYHSNRSAILSFDISRGEVVEEDIPELKDRVNAFCFDGEKYWFTGRKTELYIWYPVTGVIECMKEFSDEFRWCYEKKDTAFGQVLCEGENIWVFQYRVNRTLCINKDTKEILEIDLGDWREDKFYEGTPMSFQYMVDERYAGLYSWKEHRIIEVDLQQKNWCYKELIDGPAIAEFLRKNPKWYKYYFGEGVLHKMFFGEMMEEDSKKELVRMEKHIGMSIHDRM